jgi:hypothetical protein
LCKFQGRSKTLTDWWWGLPPNLYRQECNFCSCSCSCCCCFFTYIVQCNHLNFFNCVCNKYSCGDKHKCGVRYQYSLVDYVCVRAVVCVCSERWHTCVNLYACACACIPQVTVALFENQAGRSSCGMCHAVVVVAGITDLTTVSKDDELMSEPGL